MDALRATFRDPHGPERRLASGERERLRTLHEVIVAAALVNAFPAVLALLRRPRAYLRVHR
jgi:hypothetical protein